MEETFEKSKLDKIKLVISDLHLADGHKVGYYNAYDDFHYDVEFYELLKYYSEGQYETSDVELIINGDFFDLLKVKYNDDFPDVITPIVGITKLKKCIEGHSIVIKALQIFLAKKKHTITYLFGNHDMDMIFPEVQELFKETIADTHDKDKIQFITERDYYRLPGGIEIHHGHQFDVINIVDYSRLIISENLPEPILNIPWGSYFVLHVLNSVIKERPYVDHVKPFPLFLLLSLIFDFRYAIKILVKVFYYFLKTRIRSSARGNSLARTLEIIFKSIVIFPHLEEHALKILKKEKEINCVIFGHSHNSKCRVFEGGKIYINIGSWLKIVHLDFENLGPKFSMTFVLIEYFKDIPRPNVNLMEWLGSKTSVIRRVVY